MTKNEPNLDGMSVAELTTLISEAQAELEKKKSEGLRSLITEMASRVEALGFTMADLIGATPAPAPARKQNKSKKAEAREVKFRGPNGETWSGVGRLPFWIKNAKGKTKKDFEVGR